MLCFLFWCPWSNAMSLVSIEVAQLQKNPVSLQSVSAAPPDPELPHFCSKAP